MNNIEKMYSYSEADFKNLPEGTYYDRFNGSLSASFIPTTAPLPEGGVWMPISGFGISVYCHPERSRRGYTPMNFFKLQLVWHIEDGNYLVGENSIQGGTFKVHTNEVFEICTNKEKLKIHRSADGEFKIVGMLDLTIGDYGDYSFAPDFKTAMTKAGYEFWENSPETAEIGVVSKCGYAVFSLYSSKFGGGVKTVVATANNATRHSSKEIIYLCPSVRDMLVGKKILTAHTEYYVRGETFKSEYITME